MSSSLPPVGYLIGSHVAYQHNALPRLIKSLALCGVSPLRRTLVCVNGSAREWSHTCDGVTYRYMTTERGSHFLPLLDHETDIEYWIYLNCTSICGPRFRSLVESGFDPDADATLAGALLSNGPSGGKLGRAINDLATYRLSWIRSKTCSEKILSMREPDPHEIFVDWEGWLFAHAPRQSSYPNNGYTIERDKKIDVYGTGTMRVVEYFPAIDWTRFKRNYGQLPPSECYACP